MMSFENQRQVLFKYAQTHSDYPTYSVPCLIVKHGSLENLVFAAACENLDAVMIQEIINYPMLGHNVVNPNIILSPFKFCMRTLIKAIDAVPKTYSERTEQIEIVDILLHHHLFTQSEIVSTCSTHIMLETKSHLHHVFFDCLKRFDWQTRESLTYDCLKTAIAVSNCEMARLALSQLHFYLNSRDAQTLMDMVVRLDHLDLFVILWNNYSEETDDPIANCIRHNSLSIMTWMVRNRNPMPVKPHTFLMKAVRKGNIQMTQLLLKWLKFLTYGKHYKRTLMRLNQHVHTRRWEESPSKNNNIKQLIRFKLALTHGYLKTKLAFTVSKLNIVGGCQTRVLELMSECQSMQNKF